MMHDLILVCIGIAIGLLPIIWLFWESIKGWMSPDRKSVVLGESVNIGGGRMI